MNKEKINLIFIGTSDFGVPSLISLKEDDDFNILAVITQPDKKSGRGQKISYSPIKKTALDLKLPVLQPKKISDIDEEIKNLNPDIIVVIAYAQLIPQKILDTPKYACMNVHGSLLPLYRGASCIQAPILNGDNKTGVSFMLMDKKLDNGPILKSLEYNLKETDTAEDVFDALSVLSAEKINEIIKNYITGKIKAHPQDDKKATYVKTISKNEGHIDWNKPALEIERFIRAMTPWPSAFAYLDKKIVKIIKTSKNIASINKYKIGELFSEDEKLYIQTKEDTLEILEIQLEGKRIMKSKDFLNGYKNLLNSVLK